MINANTANDFIFQSLGPEMMVYDKQQDRVHVLNETAALILHLYQEGRRFTEIELKIRQGYSLNEERSISEDISLILNQMEGCGLI